MARINYSPAGGFGDKLYIPLGDGRFIQLLEGTFDYPDEAAYKLMHSQNPAARQMVRSGQVAVFIDALDDGPNNFDMAPGNSIYGMPSGNGVQMAPLTPVDVGMGVIDANGQMINQAIPQPTPTAPTYGMTTAANGLFTNNGQGVLLSAGGGTFAPNGAITVTATNAPTPQQQPQPPVSQPPAPQAPPAPPAMDLNPTINPTNIATSNTVAPEFQPPVMESENSEERVAMPTSPKRTPAKRATRKTAKRSPSE